MISISIKSLLVALLLRHVVANVPIRERKLQSELQEGESCFTGFVMDTFCIERGRLLDANQFESLKNPEMHSVHCLVDISLCVNSGFEILTPPEAGSDTYVRAAKLDDDGTDMCVELARSIGQCDTCQSNDVEQRLGFAATVIGTLDESVFPPLMTVREVFAGSEECPPPATTALTCPEGTFSIGTSCVCFSGQTMVETDAKGTIMMKDLEIGDNVHVGNNKYEEVYSFGHYKQDTEATYLVFNHDLEISATHMVAVADTGFVPASAVKVGDSLLSGADQSLVEVTSISTKRSKGMFAPFTASGKIVVNGVVASTFVTMQEDSATLSIGGIDTGLSWQFLAQSFELPHRAVCTLVDCSIETYTDSGVAAWVVAPRQLAQWLNHQEALVAGLVWFPILGLVGMLAVAEILMGWVGLVLVVVGVFVMTKSRRTKTKSL